MGFAQQFLSWTLSLGLAGLIFFAGATKLTPVLNPEFHAEHNTKFAAYHGLMPNQFTQNVNPEQYRQLVGLAEVIISLFLVLPPLRRLGAVLLIAIMIGACWVHHQLNDQFGFPLVVGSVALLTWIVSGKSKTQTANSKKKQ